MAELGTIYALVSAGGSPGVTTAALAIALTWPAEVVVAECDPGGGDILPGLLTGHVPASQGLMDHAIQVGRDPREAAASLPTQLVPLGAHRTVAVLPGVSDPRQALGLASAWPAVTATLTAHRADIVADCGRLDAGPAQPIPVLAAADVIAVVLRPTLRQVWAARSRVDLLRQILGGLRQVGLLSAGHGDRSAHELAHVLDVPVIATLPQDARTAALLSDGAGSRAGVMSAPLLRAARAAGSAFRKRAAALALSPDEAGTLL